jgi:histidinol phosphatase-like enzyme (inositol monophosphatase family)
MHQIKYNNFVSFALNTIIKNINNINKKISKSKINFSSKKKNEMDPVTIFDKNIEKIIRNTIEKKFPEHSITGEELEEKSCISNYKWILDPIDGTKALLAGQPTWSNLISLYYKNKPVFGLANFPCLNKIFFSNAKNSFIINGKKKYKIKTSKIVSLKKSKLITNSIHTFVNHRIYKFFKNYPNFFKITGVDAYNFCLLSEGKIDIIIESGLKQVDILPIIPIVEKAGGIIVNWQGKNDLSAGQIIACSNKILLKKFLNYFKNNY